MSCSPLKKSLKNPSRLKNNPSFKSNISKKKLKTYLNDKVSTLHYLRKMTNSNILSIFMSKIYDKQLKKQIFRNNFLEVIGNISCDKQNPKRKQFLSDDNYKIYNIKRSKDFP